MLRKGSSSCSTKCVFILSTPRHCDCVKRFGQGSNLLLSAGVKFKTLVVIHFCDSMWSLFGWIEATLCRVFFIICLYMYCRWRSRYQAGRVGIPLTGLTPTHLCACSKAGPGFLNVIYVVVFFFYFSDKR